MSREPAYVISVVSRVLQMHPQTLRKYERAGLLRPERSEGMLRLYSDADLSRLRLIKRLVDEVGLNVAGVRLVLDLVDGIQHLESLAGHEHAPRTRAAAEQLLDAVGLVREAGAQPAENQRNQ